MQRRNFLEMVGKVGGASALLGTMEAMGLAPVPMRKAFALTGSGAGKRVLVLGAGVAGLTVAYELGKLGYDCRILEARGVPGGRCHTIRRGVTERDTGGVSQSCTFDAGLYFNPGAMRIPHHHTETLDYCRELGVPLEIFGHANEGAFWYYENQKDQPSRGPLAGRRVRVREVRADVQGYTAELLAKAMNQHELDERVTADDRDKFLAFLRSFGRLDPDMIYRRSETRGHATARGAGDRPGTVSDPLALRDLIRAGLVNQLGGGGLGLETQMPMFQPVGGMDRIAHALASAIGRDRIRYDAEVREIRRVGTDELGVRVAWADKAGRLQESVADLCVCTVPLPVLATIPSDFCPEMQRAIATPTYAKSGKIGVQCGRRFWEEDDQVFGGTSQTNLTISQMVYPSFGWLGRKGVLINSYANGPRAEQLSAMAPAERHALALAEGAKIHPQYPRHAEAAFSMYWHTSPHHRGAWANYTPETRKSAYPILCRPDGPVHLAGEHCSYITSWLAGAFDSGRAVATDVHTRLSQRDAIALTGAV